MSDSLFRLDIKGRVYIRARNMKVAIAFMQDLMPRMHYDANLTAVDTVAQFDKAKDDAKHLPVWGSSERAQTPAEVLEEVLG